MFIPTRRHILSFVISLAAIACPCAAGASDGPPDAATPGTAKATSSGSFTGQTANGVSPPGNQLEAARAACAKSLERGRGLEAAGEHGDAYLAYSSAVDAGKLLLSGGQPQDAELANNLTAGAARSLAAIRKRAQEAMEYGAKLVAAAKYTEAYEGYLYAISGTRQEALRASGQAADTKLADGILARIVVLQSLVPKPRTTLTARWTPRNNQELKDARAHNQQTWPQWQKLCLDVAAAGTETVEFGSNTDLQSLFEAKVGHTLEVFTRLVDSTDPIQRAQHSYQQMLAGIKELGNANRHWDNAKDRKQYLMNAGGYFSALHDFVGQKDGYPDDIW